jgi:hypothetical protein
MLQTFLVHVTTMLQVLIGTLMWEVLGVEHDKVTLRQNMEKI